MAIAKRAQQLSVTMPNKIGLLAEVTIFIAAAKINIEAICAYEMEDEGCFMLITNNTAKTKKILLNMGAEVETDDVIMVEMPNKPGQIHRVAKKISDAGIDVHYVYGSPARGKMTIIFKTADDKKAVRLLNK
ncbi:MAG: ACT domain-containing protein [Deltaproteobacteria bacterium]|nr:ACT domain-containing protein [Deltaproteobacteria bacterium]